LPGSVLHVGSRGVDQRTIFRDRADRTRFLVLLADVVTLFRWRCLSYCLMTNHYHLVIQLREANLSGGMQSLNGRYARAFNERHVRTGHLFEHRFWSELVTREAHILSLARYVALNPVRARLCRSAEDWPWSAHGALAGERPAGFVDVEAILCHFDEDPRRAAWLYSNYVACDDPVEDQSPSTLDVPDGV
jgi:REP element-mobilizing transposase RayT